MIDLILNKQNHAPNTSNHEEQKKTDSQLKSFVKTLSWRIVGTVDTMVISYLVTGQLDMAFSIGSIEVITKMILYYFHERAWSKIKW